MKVFKYIISHGTFGTRRVQIVTPARAQLLRAEMQNGEVVLWALVDDVPFAHETRILAFVREGESFDGPVVAYLGSVPGVEPLHIFEVLF